MVVDYEADLERMQQAQQEVNALSRQAELGKHRFEQRPALAWTPLGHDLIPVEVAARPGQGHAVPDAEVAGLLREPAEAALSYVRDNAARLLPAGWFAAHDIRVFQPYGPPPADPGVQGKDAGLALSAALVSLLSGRIVRPEVAVTGGLTPAGDLLPVARLKDKVATTRRAFIQHLVAPSPQGGQAPSHHDGDPELILVSTADEALKATVARHQAKNYTPPS